MSIGARVSKCRLGAGSALAFLEIELGNVTDAGFSPFLKVNELVLRESKDGGYWLSFPSKQRMKNGAPVLNASGRAIYDEYVTSAFEQIDGEWAPTEGSRKFKTYLEKIAGAAYEAALAEGAGRGAPAAVPRANPTPRAAPAAAPAARTATRQPLVQPPARQAPALLPNESAADIELPF